MRPIDRSGIVDQYVDRSAASDDLIGKGTVTLTEKLMSSPSSPNTVPPLSSTSSTTGSGRWLP